MLVLGSGCVVWLASARGLHPYSSADTVSDASGVFSLLPVLIFVTPFWQILSVWGFFVGARSVDQKTVVIVFVKRSFV